MLRPIEKTVQETNEFLKDIMNVLDTEDEQFAYHALKSVLHALRDRITIQESADFAAQLPNLLKGIYYDGWQPSKVPVKIRTKEEFFALVLEYFPKDMNYMINPTLATSAVFNVLATRISTGEIEDIQSILPKDLKDLWPDIIY